MNKKNATGHNFNDHEDDYTQIAINKMIAAKPASGFRPETNAEWAKTQEALLALGYALLRKSGLSRKQAEQMAQLIYGGAAGRLMLDMGFEVLGDE